MPPAQSDNSHDSPRVCFIQPHQDINIHPVPRKKTDFTVEAIEEWYHAAVDGLADA